MVDQAKHEFIMNLKQLITFFNSLPSTSKQNNEHGSELFRFEAELEKITSDPNFKYEVNPFDKSVLKNKTI